jgi:BASS family bile acid:Na+ symporter
LALVVLAICAGAPLLPKKLIKFGGDPSYVFSLIVTTSLLAIVTVPASLHFLAEIISFDTSAVTPSQVARIILKTFLLPLGVGMLFRLAVPALADRFGDPLLKIASAVMALCALAALAVGFRLVLEVGLPSLIAFAAFTLSAIVVGHLLGGPNHSDRISLAIACASRHIGLALLIAANARGQHALALVVAYLLASAVVSIPYVRWITKHRPPA